MLGLAAACAPTLVESPVLSLVSPVPTGSGAHTWHSSRGSPSPLLNQMGTDVSVRGTEPRVIASGPTHQQGLSHAKSWPGLEEPAFLRRGGLASVLGAGGQNCTLASMPPVFHAMHVSHIAGCSA